ncbi:hypothetical protein HDU77_001665 [Chytriomyces hyalinus]|nr:hypothetical protein HDU77_001665 [Chytriomyces hyalinus]
MPLTKEQAHRVHHEVDEAGLVNHKSCLDRITALSTAFKCDVATVKNCISNHQQKKKRAANAAAVSAVGSGSTRIQQPDENPPIPNHLQELDDILVQKPRKVRLVASENTPGYHLFLRTIGKEMKEENKRRRKDDSQAELIQMNEFQMVTSDSGVQLGSKWAALSQHERDEYARKARSLVLATKENVDATGSSTELHEAQRKAYSIMVNAIRNFVKLGGTHIGTSRLPYESDDNRRIVTVADGDFAEETTRQTATAALKHQTAKVLTFLDLRQRLEQSESNGKIIACPKKVVGGVQTRREAFQRDLLRKFQKLKPDATRVPLRELREGKCHGVRMLNWPSSVARNSSFNEKELDILEQNPVLLVESTDDWDDISSETPVDENAEQASVHLEEQRNSAGQQTGSRPATGEIDASDTATSFGRNFNLTQFEIPASYNQVAQARQSVMDLDGTDLDAIATLLNLPI